MSSLAPTWFDTAISHEPEDRAVIVEGATIRYLSWGDRKNPGLVFVHGGAAHAHWWSFIAPLFVSEWHAVAIHLSGMGDSDRRDSYSHEVWAREVMAVAEDAEFPGPPVVVGHSLGGMVTIQTAATFGGRLKGAVIVDAPVSQPAPESEESRSSHVFRTPGTYATLEQAVSHFALVPRQPCENDYIIDYIARMSVHETDEGWTWKFDPNIFERTHDTLRDQLASVKCRVALFTGEKSVVVPPDTAAYMYELMGRVSPVIEIPEAHHHLTLDQPLAFVAALRTLLADWHHSIAFERGWPVG
ncbi:MAG: alpha/beta hydrolase [Acidimicrobiia bacterium]|nr:MAG: alpha/beta hydrolase [Acidimicrobiia bacterium]